MSDKDASFTRISFHVGSDWRVYCHTYPDTTPILDIGTGTMSVGISVRDRSADKAAVEFTRDLARQVGKFAAEVERMYAAQYGGDGKAADSDAA
jgi:hypothetical protein